MSDVPFSKENLDQYLKELAKEYRKRSGKNVPAEITLIGGASVLINYGFREMTYDMDAIIKASSSMKDAINQVGDRYGLPNGWINDDFKTTPSYSEKIEQFSKYYHTYSNIVTYRTISGEYLVAMKMRSGRKYKYDRSDIIGILRDQKAMGDELTFDRIKKAVIDLYGSYDVIDEEVRKFVEKALNNGNYIDLYENIRVAEETNKNSILAYQRTKPNVVTNDNANDIIEALKRRNNL